MNENINKTEIVENLNPLSTIKHSGEISEVIFKKQNLLESRIALCILSLINEDSTGDDIFQFKLKDLIAIGEYDASSIYSRASEAAKHLSGLYIDYDEAEEKSFDYRVIFKRIAYKDGIIKAQIDDWAIPGLFNLKNKYKITKYPFDEVMSLNQKHSIQLYSLVKKEMKENQTIQFSKELDYLRIYFEATDSYDKNTDFIRHIIDKSIEDINKNTELKIEAEPIKTKRTFTHIQFTVKKEDVFFYVNPKEERSIYQKFAFIKKTFSRKEISLALYATIYVFLNEDLEINKEIFDYFEHQFIYEKKSSPNGKVDYKDLFNSILINEHKYQQNITIENRYNGIEAMNAIKRKPEKYRDLLVKILE